MGLSFGKQLLIKDANEDMREQEKWAREESKSRGLFGSIGGLLGAFLPIVLAPLTGGLSLLATAAVAGIGSAAGTKLGTMFGDKQVDDVQTRFGQSTLASLHDSLDENDTAAWMKAGLQAGLMSGMGGFIAGGAGKASEAASAAASNPNLTGTFAQRAFEKTLPGSTVGSIGSSFADRAGAFISQAPSEVVSTAVGGSSGNLLGNVGEAFLKSGIGGEVMGKLSQSGLGDQVGAATISGPEAGFNYAPPMFSTAEDEIFDVVNPAYTQFQDQAANLVSQGVNPSTIVQQSQDWANIPLQEQMQDSMNPYLASPAESTAVQSLFGGLLDLTGYGEDNYSSSQYE